MKEITVRVIDMKCDGCEATIRKALFKVGGVYDAQADHKTGKVWMQVNESVFRIVEANETIRKLGYKTEEN